MKTSHKATVARITAAVSEDNASNFDRDQHIKGIAAVVTAARSNDRRPQPTSPEITGYGRQEV